MRPLIKISQIRYAPLIPSSQLRGVDPDLILRKLRSEVLKRVRANILQTVFSKRAKEALAKAIKIEVRPRSLSIMATHPAFKMFVEGRRRRQMKWLVKARAPIPIITEEGRLIFRTATPKSMRDGKWIHPGRAPSDFFSKARKEARDVIKNRLKRDLQRQLADAIRKGR